MEYNLPENNFSARNLLNGREKIGIGIGASSILGGSLKMQQSHYPLMNKYAPFQYRINTINLPFMEFWSNINEQKSNLIDRYGNNFNLLIPAFNKLIS